MKISLALVAGILFILSCGEERQSNGPDAQDERPYVFQIPSVRANAALVPTAHLQKPVPLSEVAFTFRAEVLPEDVADVRVTVSFPGVTDAEVESRFYDQGGVLVVAVSLPMEELTYTLYVRFMNPSGEVVATYRPRFEPDRHLLTYHDQQPSKYVVDVHHNLPPEIGLSIGEPVAVELGKSYRLWVGDQFLDLRQVACLPNDGSAPQRVVPNAKCEGDCTPNLWAPVADSAELVMTGVPVEIERGACLTLGVSTPDPANVSLELSPVD